MEPVQLDVLLRFELDAGDRTQTGRATLGGAKLWVPKNGP